MSDTHPLLSSLYLNSDRLAPRAKLQHSTPPPVIIQFELSDFISRDCHLLCPMLNLALRETEKSGSLIFQDPISKKEIKFGLILLLNTNTKSYMGNAAIPTKK